MVKETEFYDLLGVSPARTSRPLRRPTTNLRKSTTQTNPRAMRSSSRRLGGPTRYFLTHPNVKITIAMEKKE